MANLRLTDITIATAVTSNSLIHIVNTGDTTQFSGGSSYKTSLSKVFDSLSGYTAQTINVNSLNLFNVGSTPSVYNLGIDTSGNVVKGKDIYVTGITFNTGTYDLSVSRNDGNSVGPVNLGIS